MRALGDYLGLAFGALRANALRTALTLLGIIIGAFTVVAMMALTEGLRLRLAHDLSELGAQRVPGAEVAGDPPRPPGLAEGTPAGRT